MIDCNHEFIGKSDGVHCVKCGLHLSTAKYARHMKQKENAQGTPKRRPRKKVKADE